MSFYYTVHSYGPQMKRYKGTALFGKKKVGKF